MNAIIPKDSAGDARAWNAPELGPGAGAAAPLGHQAQGGLQDEALNVDLPTARALETVFDQAQTQGHDEGFKLGRVEGHAAGLQEGRAQATVERQALLDLLSRLHEPIQQLAAATEAAVVALALEIARQVVISELRTRPEGVLDVLHRALDAYPAHAGIPWVRLHPDDVKLLHALAPELEAGGLSLVPDEALQRGDLILATGSEPQRAMSDRRWRPRCGHDVQSELDLRIEERWRQVMARLFEEGSL
ncbi:MAG: flagellar assembly protein FliH [Betaproteobacteria bacterium]|nr:flagellar assembly protein FliH [Betaproteobacteria bacterium]